MLIAHISDLHITEEGTKACGKTPTADNLTHCVKHINQLNPQPEIVLVTGDICNEGLLSETKRSKSILDALKPPYYLIPGNHDSRENLWEVFGEKNCLGMEQGFINYEIKKYDVRLIGIDSTISGKSGGEICQTRANWLEHKLAEDSEKPTILFMHHPPVKLGVLETDEDGFIGADLLGNIVEKHSNIQAILCGHIHIQTHIPWRGTTISTSPSMGLQLLLDLSLKLPSQFYNDVPAYQLHYWTPEQNLVSFAISTRELEGPYLF